jgi:prolyl oligopeptidase
MIRMPLFGSGKTWVPEYGDPEKEDDFNVLYAYSPYHHVKEGVEYPPMLMMSADHDDRVDPMHARKFTALVQKATRNKSPAWLRIEMHSGHGGSDLVKQTVQASADWVAFLLYALDVKPPVTASEAKPAAPAPTN